jgi:hypothetical protein
MLSFFVILSALVLSCYGLGMEHERLENQKRANNEKFNTHVVIPTAGVAALCGMGVAVMAGPWGCPISVAAGVAIGGAGLWGLKKYDDHRRRRDASQTAIEYERQYVIRVEADKVRAQENAVKFEKSKQADVDLFADLDGARQIAKRRGGRAPESMDACVWKEALLLARGQAPDYFNAPEYSWWFTRGGTSALRKMTNAEVNQFMSKYRIQDCQKQPIDFRLFGTTLDPKWGSE